jgi:hypothetical protein
MALNVIFIVLVWKGRWDEMQRVKDEQDEDVSTLARAGQHAVILAVSRKKTVTFPTDNSNCLPLAAFGRRPLKAK